MCGAHCTGAGGPRLEPTTCTAALHTSRVIGPDFECLIHPLLEWPRADLRVRASAYGCEKPQLSRASTAFCAS